MQKYLYTEQWLEAIPNKNGKLKGGLKVGD
jgi:hypothetical protein